MKFKTQTSKELMTQEIPLFVVTLDFKDIYMQHSKTLITPSIRTLELSLNVFFRIILWQNYYFPKRLFEPATSYVRDLDAITARGRQGSRENLWIEPNSCFTDLSDSLNSLNSLNLPSIYRKLHRNFWQHSYSLLAVKYILSIINCNLHR